jgi:hypothetical protein
LPDIAICLQCAFSFSVPAKVLSVRNNPVKVAVGKTAELACTIQGYPIENFDWQKLTGGSEK